MSKEEIEKAKEWLNWIQKQDLFLPYTSNILQYIDQLEVSNKELDKENNRLEKIEFERDKKNKIIDEMANYISNLDIDEDICKKVKISLCADETSVPVSYCIECIKQYFEKKVEEK